MEEKNGRKKRKEKKQKQNQQVHWSDNIYTVHGVHYSHNHIRFFSRCPIVLSRHSRAFFFSFKKKKLPTKQLRQIYEKMMKKERTEWMNREIEEEAEVEKDRNFPS